MDDSVIDYPSDTESSLSRSSSLIQFESLERQLQNDSFSSSSPLLPVLVDQDFERFIPLAQLQLQHQNLTPVTVSIKTKVLLPTPYSLLATASSLDGCSVVSPTTDKHHPRLIANHGATSKSTLSTFFSPATFVKDRGPVHRDKPSTFERIRGKSSQEELSEDSGYCGDHSQSIGSAEGGGDISSKQSACSDELDCTSLQAERVAEDEEDSDRGLKIAANFASRERHLPTSTGAEDHQPQQVGMADCGGLTCIDDCDGVEEEEPRAINTRENKRTQHRKRNIPFGVQKKNLGGCQRMIPTSRSLPNIFLNQTTCDEAADNCNGTSSSAPVTPKGDHLVDSDDFKVNSFPEGLNYLLSGGVCGSYSDEDIVSGDSGDECSRDFEECQEYGYYFLHHDHQEEDFLHRDTDIFGGTIASKNLDLNQFVVPSNRFDQSPVLQQQSRAGVLSASYSNLTSLDYSEGTTPTRLLFSKMDLKRGGGGSVPRPTIANPEITLLDEISFNFDKNLSIINDRCGTFEPLIEDKDGEEEEMAEAAMVIGILNIKKPPKPPPRRFNRTGDSLENLKVPSTSKSCSNASSRESLTFDRDPTNLVTCYAASLERCNFATMDQPILNHRSSTASLQIGGLVSGSDVDLGGTSAAIPKETRHDKEMVVSTPNLSMRVGRELQVFSGNMSADCKSKTVGSILNSRNSLKEVSFHPIVSEISWRHEEIEPDSLSEDSLNGDEEDECQENRGSDSDVESDGGKYRDEEDYFGLKKNENFKDLDLASTVQKCKSTPVLSGTPSVDFGQRQIITIKKTIILTPVSYGYRQLSCLSAIFFVLSLCLYLDISCSCL